ncbi:MAG: Nif3-like dinuclear metal center hexameric protein [Actinomycetales bacterium]|nr:Nif3-like dinuclear metal center hexameric protein [Actinomycetales bacterium]
MSIELKQVISELEKLWPLAGAEEWDAPGLVTGSPTQSVSRILLTVDVTREVLAEAIDGAFDLIIAHHPYLMRGVTTLSEDTVKGDVIATAIRHGVAIYAAHTNADIVQDGVSDVMAKALGIVGAAPLVQSSSSANIGHGRIGRLESSMTLGDFARHIARVLPATATGVRVAGDYNREVNLVAVCGGAGDSFIAAAAAQNADVYVTSDLRHHPAQDAVEAVAAGIGGPALIDVSHWAAEWLWLDTAAAQITGIFEGLQVVVSHLRTDPWDFVVTQ